jgi:hypothetical protein
MMAWCRPRKIRGAKITIDPAWETTRQWQTLARLCDETIAECTRIWSKTTSTARAEAETDLKWLRYERLETYFNVPTGIRERLKHKKRIEAQVARLNAWAAKQKKQEDASLS